MTTMNMQLMAYMMLNGIELKEIEMIGKTAIFHYDKNEYENKFNTGKARVDPVLFHQKSIELRARINQQKDKKSYY